MSEYQEQILTSIREKERDFDDYHTKLKKSWKKSVNGMISIKRLRARAFGTLK